MKAVYLIGISSISVPDEELFPGPVRPGEMLDMFHPTARDLSYVKFGRIFGVPKEEP